MDIKIYGAGQEVGRCCIEINNKGRRFILDSGVMIEKEGVATPLEIPHLNYIQNVFLSHVHLDHTGYLPNLYAKGLRCPIYTSPLTKKVLPILLKDSWKIAMIQERMPGYRKSDINKVLDLVLEYEEDEFGNSEFDIAGGKVKSLNAGHIPGSRSIQLTLGDESVLFTGDISLATTRLVPTTNLDNFPLSDVLIMESTYGGRNHPNRVEEEARFISKINETLDSGSQVIIPTFSIGRGQEILLLLSEHNLLEKVPVYYDGMVKKIAQEYFYCKELVQAYSKVKLVECREDRLATKNEPCIVITTSGMLDGGPICEYLKLYKDNSEVSILLTGYQAEESNGFSLLKNKTVKVDDHTYSISGYVEKFNFSSHADHDSLCKIIDKVSPKHLILIHGSVESIDELAKYAAGKQIQVHAPKNGDVIHIAKSV